MRFLIRARIPTEAENKLVQDPNFLKKARRIDVDKIKPEAVYFMPFDGHRAMAFIVNMQGNDQVPAIVEPLSMGRRQYRCGSCNEL